MKKNRTPVLPIILLFIIMNGVFVTARKMLERNGFDQDVLIIGNLILFVVSALSFIIGQRALRSKNPQAFVRGIMMSTMIKLFICAIAAFIYIMTYKNNVSKPSLIACAGLYIIYTVIEVSALKKLLKGNNA